ncbi:DUF1450 domain-containing protein [Marinitoga lauensis]|uniref:DUF1450 domain-containing protein n=1 Tax=Marinitoga lauensis TaxID=2201189 RepID=UPI001404691B|nr:DUF1450 domain-containing protein [Marinitoga lauensis]
MIQLCKNNKGVEKIIEYLENNDIEYFVANCLDECNICHSKVFVKKDEEIIAEETVEELLNKI